ncbi:MAG TPA: ribosomal-protein-alanine acetyltransferase [Porticoccaceae bacterium]|nr:ribosomal-protein-alanine acetyltransferase [Porticoccaceae bacterium]
MIIPAWTTKWKTPIWVTNSICKSWQSSAVALNCGDASVLDAKVRPATVADTEALLVIESRCFTSDKISPRQMRYLLSRGVALNTVAELDGKPVAYTVCLVPGQQRPARLYSIAVMPECQGRGLSTLLLTSLIEQLRQRGCQRLRLEVRASPSPARTLYQKFGFTLLKKLPAYYEDGEDGLRLQLNLLNGTEQS